MTTRADRIEEILLNSRGRLPVPQIVHELATMERGDEEALNAAVSATVRQDNQVRVKRGQAKRFRVFERDGGGDEERGVISLVAFTKASKTDEEKIAELVSSANSQVRESLKKHIEGLPWQEFEQAFLPELLEALGFEDVTLTQKTRDGGVDARCTYNMGLVSQSVIVSAKHWKSTSPNVGVSVIRELKGVSGDDEIGIIVTTSRFTDAAIEEARSKSPGSRTIIPIDGETILDTCMENRLGVEEMSLPPLFKLKPFPKPD